LVVDKSRNDCRTDTRPRAAQPRCVLCALCG